MAEPGPIDMKDIPGPYRDEVRAAVLGRLGGGGPLARPEELTGSWDVAFDRSLGGATQPAFVYHLRPDGTSEVEVAGGEVGPTTGHWSLNPDGTFSLMTWCPPLPEVAIPEWGMEEARFHLAGLADGRRVIWDGDGSLVLVLSPRGA
jgi:hypothetical protein